MTTPRSTSRIIWTTIFLAAGLLTACRSNGDKPTVPDPTTKPGKLSPLARPGDMASTSAPQLDQGVVGRVVKLTGNHMPGPGPRRGKSQPLSVPVHIFKGSVQPFGDPDLGHPQLVATAHCKSDGTFRVPLPAGEYTVVAEIDGKLYLNCFQGDGTWCTVSVVKNAWTKTNIQDTSDAAF